MKTLDQRIEDCLNKLDRLRGRQSSIADEIYGESVKLGRLLEARDRRPSPPKTP